MLIVNSKPLLSLESSHIKMYRSSLLGRMEAKLFHIYIYINAYVYKKRCEIVKIIGQIGETISGLPEIEHQCHQVKQEKVLQFFGDVYPLSMQIILINYIYILQPLC